MSRQNVGKPRFYIDYIQYWNARGLIKGIGAFAADNVSDISIGGSLYRPHTLGLNPSNYKVTTRYTNEWTIGDEALFSSRWGVSLNKLTHLPDTNRMFISCLNHDFHETESNIAYVEAHNMNGVPDTEASWTNAGLAGGTYTNVINCSVHGGTADYNGFSILEFDAQTAAQTINESGGIDLIDIYQVYSDVLAAADAENRDNIIGSLNFGAIYEMSHSPDLELTMTRTYDGIQTQKTLSGGRMTKVNYTGPAAWRNDLPAWTLTNEAVDTTAVPNNISRGRRSWDMSFSYMSDSNLLALNESLTPFNASDTSNAGYDTDDFISGTSNFVSTIESDSSFFGAVVQKTMGGALPFIFQPDSNNSSPDQFAICVIDQDSISFEQVANNVYNISLKISEVW